MYIPKHFEQKDKAKTIAFMQTYNFAILASVKDAVPVATHLPFVIEERENNIILFSHMSKANEQWKAFSEKQVLVIFSEPHAYISPKLYEKKQNVTTWNYISVHAYGKINRLNTDEQKLDVLHKQMQFFEADYLEQFNSLDKKYVDGLLKGIVAFEIIVRVLQSKEKLNQNKSPEDRLNVKKYLEDSGDDLKIALGKRMPGQG
jgi:transcriptional regulator